ncbi:MAG: hypothetical protein JNL21_24285 [Myxococcales bacterium]|nr:hypothetical protein [Myxococcales bacterium]
MMKPEPNRRSKALLAALAVVGCSPAASDARLVEIPASSADAARAEAAAAQEATTPPFQRSSCVREGSFGSIELGLASHPEVAYASVSSATARLWLASGTSSTVFVEAASLGAELEGIAALPSIPLGVSKAFEGFAAMRKPGYGRRGLIRKTTPLPDGRFELTLAPPDGLEVANEDALRVVASCEELAPLGDEPLSVVPTSPNERPATLARERVPLSRTPGGTPVAFVTDRSECGRPVVRVDQQGSSALVRIYLDQAVVYGWIDAADLGPPPPNRLRDTCEFGMIGLLNAGAGSTEQRPTRHVCKRPMPLFARKADKPIRVGQLTQESCLHVTQARKQDGFVAVELEGRVSTVIEPKPGVALYVTEADWAGCEREEPSDRPAWGLCD